MKCRSCGAALDLTMGSCPACGTEVELGRLTGILGIVCRACDAYNEPGARACAACGKPLGKEAPEKDAAATPATPPAPAIAVTPPSAAPPTPGAGPVVRSFAKDGGQATRFVPAAAIRAAAAGPGTTALPATATACPRCGTPSTVGSFCAQCGQPLGERGTQAMPRPPGVGAATQVLAPPTSKGRGRLVVVGGDGRDGATFPLDADVVEAGRARGTVLFPDDPFLAPHHATFFWRGAALHVRDEGAPGGTFLRLRGLSVPLRPGDCFALGDRLLRFVGPLAPPLAPATDGTRRLGAPRPAGQAIVLEETLEGGGTGRVFVRSGPSVTLGRAGCAVNLGDGGSVAPAHAELLVEADGTARLRDLASSTGTFVRLPPRAERELRNGDAVRIGREVLRVAEG